MINSKLVLINVFTLDRLNRPSHTASSGSSKLAYQRVELEQQGWAVTGTTNLWAIPYHTEDWKTAMKDSGIR